MQKNHSNSSENKDICEILQSLKDKNETEFEIESSRSTNWATHNSFILTDDKSQFITFDKKNSYLQINFKNKFVDLYGYRISSSMNSYRSMRNWVLLGSSDRINWIVLDEHCNDDSLQSDDSSIITFSLYSQGIKLNSIKLIQTGKNNKFDNILAIRYFDIIGKFFI